LRIVQLIDGAAGAINALVSRVSEGETTREVALNGLGEVSTSDAAVPVAVEILDLDGLSALGPLWDELRFSEVIDACVPDDPQVKLRTSTIIKALVLNVVSGRDPLYRVSHAWANKPMQEILGGASYVAVAQ
jgi:hypothetical protein